ncbi:hypothetical protein N1851_019190 [Merluccius polli]|uniref:Uncharacterized protein n=1 Tax=Merluccius polli TaxID=89951 RepID=A0AA47MMK9_MERPO|nr:hypothetical protein N1851_019190 [Merluccius polli]
MTVGLCSVDIGAGTQNLSSGSQTPELDYPTPYPFSMVSDIYPWVLLHGLVLLGFSVLTLVVLLRLIGWWRTRGNKTATEKSIQHTVDKDLDRAPRGPSVVQCGEQRPVGSAQDQVDPGEFSDEATYENMRAPPGCVGDTEDTGVHFVTVHQLTK